VIVRAYQVPVGWLRATAGSTRPPSIDTSKPDSVLDALRTADVAEFDAALPASVVTPAQRSTVVDEMLKDVPIPPGFDIEPVAAEAVYTDRVALATAVAVHVSCGWLDEWFIVWETEDATELDTILDALESSHDWPMLADITPEQSGFPEQLGQIVDSLRTGGSVMTGAGPAPITRDTAAQSLGCTW